MDFYSTIYTATGSMKNPYLFFKGAAFRLPAPSIVTRAGDIEQ
jgi:hypothetical protein